MRATRRGTVLASVMALCITGLAHDVADGRQSCVTGFDPPAWQIPPRGSFGGTPVSFTILTASSTCAWTWTGPVFFPSWLDVPAPVSGTGPGTVSFNGVMPNHGPSPRSVELTFDHRPITVTQAGNPCPLTVTPSTVTLPANGGTGSVTVTTTGSPCSYAVSPPADVTIVSGGSGSTFPAIVTFSMAPNSTQEDEKTRSVLFSSLDTFLFAPYFEIQQNGPPVVTDSARNEFTFAVHRGDAGPPHISAPEPLRITNAENPTDSWTATVSEPWLVLTPSSGVTPATTTISVNPAAVAVLSRGTYTGTLEFFSPVAPQSPRRVTVNLLITDATSTTRAPIGFVDLPVQNATGLNGAVPVSGWAVDDVGIRRILIFRNSVAGEPPADIFLGDGTRVRGARPDIYGLALASGVPWPETSNAGWGLMVLSNVLPNGGNGTFTLKAYADDVEGQRSLLGQTTVTFDNTSAPFPFGTIDLPGQGATVSGTLQNGGWILAQPGKAIPFDGSTIRVLVDGAIQPNAATYGLLRPDVRSFFPFPTYANANGAGAQFVLNTTQFADGLHTIVWLATDDQGVTQGIGSRFFHIQNGAASQAFTAAAPDTRSASEVRALPQADAFVWERKGFDDGVWSLRSAWGQTNEIRQAPGERLELTLDTWWWSRGCGPYAGYLITGDVAAPLPAGASLDGEQGIFRWMPPAEFSGTFEFAFVRRGCSGREERIPLRVIIGPGG
jgi:hypothetical protein